MIHAATVDEQLFCRALAIINAPWIGAVEEGLTAATGRPRVHSPRTVLGLLAITALEREGEIVFAKAARVTRRLNPWQKHRLGLVCPIDGKQVSRTLKEIARGLVSQVDPRTGEVRPRRGSRPGRPICSQRSSPESSPTGSSPPPRRRSTAPTSRSTPGDGPTIRTAKRMSTRMRSPTRTSGP